MVTEVRQRATRDPVWVNRRLRLTGADDLTAQQWARLTAKPPACDPTNEIGAAWAVKERLRLLLAESELAAWLTKRTAGASAWVVGIIRLLVGLDARGALLLDA